MIKAETPPVTGLDNTNSQNSDPGRISQNWSGIVQRESSQRLSASSGNHSPSVVERSRKDSSGLLQTCSSGSCHGSLAGSWPSQNDSLSLREAGHSQRFDRRRGYGLHAGHVSALVLLGLLEACRVLCPGISRPPSTWGSLSWGTHKICGFPLGFQLPRKRGSLETDTLLFGLNLLGRFHGVGFI